MPAIDRTLAAESCEDEQRKRHRIPVAHGFADPLIEFRVVAGQHRCDLLDRRAVQSGLIDKFPYVRLDGMHWIRRLSCAQLPSNALEELVDDRTSGSANHTLSDAGDRAACGDISGIVKQRARVIGGQLNRSFALYKSRCAAAFGSN